MLVYMMVDETLHYRLAEHDLFQVEFHKLRIIKQLDIALKINPGGLSTRRLALS